MIDKIYIDLDMTLADFDEGLMRICGIAPRNQESASEEDDKKLWEAIKEAEHFYAQLKPLEEGMAVFNTLYSRYGNKCEILSAIPKPKRGIIHAKDDKLAWVKRYLGEDIKVNIVMREEKKDYVKGKGYILIDDLKRNIDEWEDQGGTGILFIDANTTLNKIEALEI